jgi:hypothetical protein
MIDMKVDSKKQSTMLGQCEPCSDDAPRYPYGLELHLNDDSLEKLGVSSENMPAIGSSIQMMAMVKVTSVRMTERTENGEDKKSMSVDLQITAMEFATEKTKSPAQVLYGK